MDFKMIPYEGMQESSSINSLAERGAQIANTRSSKLFLLKRLYSFVLAEIAYFCPINSIRIWCHRQRGVKIGKHVHIGLHCVLDYSYPEYITLEDYVTLSGEVYVLTHSRPRENFRGKLLSYIAPVHIKKGAWLTVRTTVLPGAVVGEDSVISAGAMVTGDIPDHSMAAGNPAVVERSLNR